jgi:hypothetical protein
MTHFRKLPNDNDRKWLPNQPEPPPGHWVPYDYGPTIRGWHLTCGGMFHADVGPGQDGYLLTLNMHPITTSWDIDELKRTAERHIVARVRKMLLAYKAIYARTRVVDQISATVEGP